MKTSKTLSPCHGPVTYSAIASIFLVTQSLAGQRSNSLPPNLFVSTSWGIKPWTADESKYQTTFLSRTYYDNAQLTDQELVAFRRRDKSKPIDSVQLFKYMYLEFASLRQQNLRFSKHATAVLQLADRTPDPRSYRFDRLRFALQAETYAQPELIPVGRRLLQRRPDDDMTKYALIIVLGCSPKLSDLEEGLKMGIDYANTPGRNIGAWGLVADVVAAKWRRTHSKEDARIAIKSIQMIQKVPSRQTPYWVSRFAKDIAMYQKCIDGK